jgi:subtilisin family serine protease
MFPASAAGIVAGQTTGVAKKTSIYSVRVLDEMGSGTIATLVDGINFVANSNLTNRIASMSLGGGKADALNDAVEAAVKAGVLVIVAAGNEATDACEISPGETRVAELQQSVYFTEGFQGGGSTSQRLATHNYYNNVIRHSRVNHDLVELIIDRSMSLRGTREVAPDTYNCAVEAAVVVSVRATSVGSRAQ